MTTAFSPGISSSRNTEHEVLPLPYAGGQIQAS